VHIDPWGKSQYQDYAKLQEAFGISAFGPEEWGTFESPHMLMRRGVVFGHRDFERIQDAIRGHDQWSVMTGLMPSGNLHMGHKMLADQFISHQQAGADVHIAVADFEAVAARGLSLEKAHEIARDQYIHNYLALGLSPENGEVYYQTRRRRVKDLADQFATRIKFGQMQGLYGFGGETSLGHINAPIIQAADILHVQQPEMGGARPVLIPVGVDQDPHLRLSRDIAQQWRMYNITETKDGWVLAVKGKDNVQRWLDVADSVLDALGIGTRTDRKRNDKHGQIGLGPRLTGRDRRALDLALAQAEQKKGPMGFIRPSATFHRFMTGLTGDKMSSSTPESSIFLTDTVDEAAKKVKRSVTGGRASADEQRAKGADPTRCPVYEMYVYHLAGDDEHLQTVYDECSGGQRLCGGCKSEAVELLSQFLTSHKEKRDQTAHLIDDIVAEE
jgi:tryptophanyl-tRNA synthetase